MSSYLANNYLDINWYPSSYNGITLSASPEGSGVCHSSLYLKGYDDHSSYRGKYYIYLDAWGDSDGATLKMDSDAKYHNSIELRCPGSDSQDSSITLTGGFNDESQTNIYPGSISFLGNDKTTTITANGGIYTYFGSFYTSVTIGKSNNSSPGVLIFYRPSSTNKWKVSANTSGELVFTYS